jgi:hypothetical protein
MALMGGRSTRPLDTQEINRVSATFIGLDPEMQNVRFDPMSRTVFRVVPATESETGDEYGEIVFGPDIYPGGSVAHPNSLLGMRAAAAHELAHYHRWLNRTQLNERELEHLDEAMTSMEAVQRYGHRLNNTEIVQLIGDALFRLNSYLAESAAGE